jgi:hypothetical protein
VLLRACGGGIVVGWSGVVGLVYALIFSQQYADAQSRLREIQDALSSGVKRSSSVSFCRKTIICHDRLGTDTPKH